MQKDTEFGLHDCGVRQEFKTGSRRDTQSGKPRPDLISPFLKLAVGNHLMLGALKYCEHNWAMGQPSSRYAESLERHLIEASLGLEDEDHLSAIVFNAMGLIHNREMKAMGLLPKELDDWPVDWIGLINGDYAARKEDRTPEQIKAQMDVAVAAKVKYMQELRNKLVAARTAKQHDYCGDRPTAESLETKLKRDLAALDKAFGPAARQATDFGALQDMLKIFAPSLMSGAQSPEELQATLKRKIELANPLLRDKRYALRLGGNKMMIANMPDFLNNLEGLPVTDGSGATIGKVDRAWLDGNYIKARFIVDGDEQEVTLYEVITE